MTDYEANDGYRMDTLRADIKRARMARDDGDAATVSELRASYDCDDSADILEYVEDVAREWCYLCGLHVSRVGL